MSGSMPMGLHIQSLPGNSGDLAREFASAVRPRMMKFLDGGADPGLMAASRAAGAMVLARVYRQDQGASGRSHEEYLESVVSFAGAHTAAVDVVEVSYNEAEQSTPEQILTKASWDIVGMREMERIGKKAAIGCFGVGWPQVEHWQLYLPALRRAAANGHYVALHEYGGGSQGMRIGVDDQGLGWYCLRYRRALNEWRRLGLHPLPKILVTEAGIDHLDQADLSTPGYKLSSANYPEDLAWYGAELQKDAEHVAGWCDFGWGGGDMWEKYDLSTDPNTLRRIAAKFVANRPAVVATPPARPPQTGPASARMKACYIVPRGAGWIAMARDLLGREPTSAEWRSLRDLNNGSAPPGGVIVSPWHKVVRL